MKVSKDSWHYRWIKKLFCTYDSNMPKTLCQYGGYMLAIYGIGLALLLTVTGMGVNGYAFFNEEWFKAVASYAGQSNIILKVFFFIGFILGIFGWFIVGCIAVVACLVFVSMGFESATTKVIGTSSEPSVLTQWFRAKKDKVCPMIEYE